MTLTYRPDAQEDMILVRSIAPALKISAWLTITVGSLPVAHARGVTPYLPLNQSPDIERKIERVLILADQVVPRRPIPAAIVLDALPKACMRDAQLCEEVQQYLQRYMRGKGITSARAEVALSSGNSAKVVPNKHGLTVGSPWDLNLSAYYQPSDYLLFNAGVVSNKANTTPTGSMISFGFDVAQLDIGYRDHWLSSLTDSSTMISTEAATMPSVTLSNYEPISPLGITYELFLAQMSKSDQIVYQDTTTSGKPRLTGMQLGIEPISGYTITGNRTFQFGGGARGGASFDELVHAFINPSHYDQTNYLGERQEFGNQHAALASSIVFPGKVPFAFHFEFAGEDTSYRSYLPGRNVMTLGVDFPRLWRRFDLGVEASEWQDAWYLHHLYRDGYTNHGNVLGHWFGDNRAANDSPWGRSQMLRLGWRLDSGDYLQATYRHLDYYFANSGYHYRPLNEVGLRYSTVRKEHALGAELYVGRDVFGENYARLAGSVDFVRSSGTGAYESGGGTEDTDDTEVFVDIGAASSRTIGVLGASVPHTYSSYELQPHLAIGARRRASERGDLGARLELDRALGHTLISVRALDYRYRFTKHFAMSAFFGASRYDVDLPMYGLSLGGGVQWLNALPRWDIGLDWRFVNKSMRAKVLPTDPNPNDDIVMYYDVYSFVTYLSYRF